jgi:hypothetical protein
MKSRPMSDHTSVGTGRGSSNPAGRRCSDLLRWQVEHARTNSCTHVGEVEIPAKAMEGALYALVAVPMDNDQYLLEER